MPKTVPPGFNLQQIPQTSYANNSRPSNHQMPNHHPKPQSPNQQIEPPHQMPAQQIDLTSPNTKVDHQDKPQLPPNDMRNHQNPSHPLINQHDNPQTENHSLKYLQAAHMLNQSLLLNQLPFHMLTHPYQMINQPFPTQMMSQLPHQMHISQPNTQEFQSYPANPNRPEVNILKNPNNHH